MDWRLRVKQGAAAVGVAYVLASALEMILLRHRVAQLEKTIDAHFLPERENFMNVELYQLNASSGRAILRFNPPPNIDDPHNREIYLDSLRRTYFSEEP